MTAEERAARRWTRATWAALAVGAVLAVAAGVALYVRWPIHVGGFLLVWTGVAVGVYVGRRPQTHRLAEAIEAATVGSATVRDLVELGPVSDRPTAERCLAAALLGVWGVSDDPTVKDQDEAADMATLLLMQLDGQGARVIPPGGPRVTAPLPATTGPPCLDDPTDQHFAVMWPAIDAIGPA